MAEFYRVYGRDNELYLVDVDGVYRPTDTWGAPSYMDSSVFANWKVDGNGWKWMEMDEHGPLIYHHESKYIKMMIYLKQPEGKSRGMWRLSISWGIFRRGSPSCRGAEKTKSWSSDLDVLGVGPMFGRNLQMVDILI